MSALEQVLNEEALRQRLVDARNRALAYQAFQTELRDAWNADEPDLIPCTEELKRLKEMLARRKRVGS